MLATQMRFLMARFCLWRPEVGDVTFNPSITPLCATRVDLTLSDGRRVLIEGPTSLGAVMSLVEGLAV